MKPLACLALLAALALPAAAQVADPNKDTAGDASKAGDTAELKKKYSGRRGSGTAQAREVQGDNRAAGGAAKALDGAAPSEPAAAPAPGKDEEKGMRLSELIALMLKDDTCSVHADDVKDIADNLKNKYGVVRCIGGPVILVPKTPLAPNQQLAYPGSKRARFTDHFVVIEFDDSVQYQDILKPTKEGFPLVGYVDVKGKNAGQFEDDGLFVDALKNYMGIKAEDSDKISAAVKAAVGSKRHRMAAGYIDKQPRVNVQSDGASYMVWPPKDK